MFFTGKYIRMKRRRRRAARLGFEFKRTAGFHPPGNLIIQGRQISLSCPNEVSAINHFFSAFLDDEYRLGVHKWNVTTVLDIGANFGFFSLAVRNTFANAKIHAYEPKIAFGKHLRHHAEQASFDIHYESVGLLDENKDSSLALDESKTRKNPIPSMSPAQVSFRQVVERLGARVDFAKIDCGGFEWDFLDDQDPWQRIHFLALKYNIKSVQKSHYDIHLALRKLGFQVLRLKPFDYHGLVFAMRL